MTKKEENNSKKFLYKSPLKENEQAKLRNRAENSFVSTNHNSVDLEEIWSIRKNISTLQSPSQMVQQNMIVGVEKNLYSRHGKDYEISESSWKLIKNPKHLPDYHRTNGLRGERAASSTELTPAVHKGGSSKTNVDGAAGPVLQQKVQDNDLALSDDEQW